MDLSGIILGLIKREPITGYDIKQIFDKTFAFFSGASYGSIYPILKKLEQKNYITAKLLIQDGKPNKKEYCITDEGVAAFKADLISQLKQPTVKEDFLTRLFYFSDVPKSDRLPMLQEYLQINVNILNELVSLGDDEDMEKADEYQKLCFQFGLDYYQNKINQIKLLIKKITLIENSGA